MLKTPESVKELVDRAARALRTLLEQVPIIKLLDFKLESGGPDHGVDIVVHLEVAHLRHALVCEVKASGQPRQVRQAISQLRNYVPHFGMEATPVLVAPYLSREAQALCREHKVAFLDLEGNAHLAFNGVFIERLVSGKPIIEKRHLRSLFRPKSAYVLRVMLRDPARPWRVEELAKAANVSLGHVSNVRAALLEREWALVSGEGLFLSKPDALLDVWRESYEPPIGKRLAFYTTLHGAAFEDTVRQTLGPKGKKARAVLASFSAAHWLAPYARTGTHYFYADDAGAEMLIGALKLSSAVQGENVVVTIPKDRGLLRDTIEPERGAICTSLVQTYLDLAIAGERGREAADHLRSTRLTWQK